MEPEKGMEKLLKKLENLTLPTLNESLLRNGAFEILSTFDERLEFFMKTVQPKDDKLAEVKKKVCDDLLEVLKVDFPKGKAYPFGSSVSGLALTTSDLDIFFDVTGNFNDSNKVQHTFEKITESALKETFDKVSKTLSGHPETFRYIVPVSYAQVPIITFKHRSTNTECDISFKQGFGVYNNKLVKFCLTLDSRIKPLIIIIKCWMQEQFLYGKRMITNYPLVLLVFFYLQKKDIQLIPPIKDLKRGISIYYRGCNVNFDENFPSTSSNCSKKIPELLRGFFKFYSEFEFGKKVICPLSGSAPEKETVQQAIDLGLNFPELKKFACIQDPIEPKRNVIFGWSETIAESFKNSCKKTSAKISSLEDKSLLPALFE